MTHISAYPSTITHDRHGKSLSWNNNTLAPLVQWWVYIQLEETSLFVSAVMNNKPNESNSYFPLMVDFRESYGAWWKIGGWTFMKREWRPSDRAILTARLIDRSLRPLFPDNMINDIVVSITPLSIDKKHDPSIISIIWASLALQLWWIPFTEAVAACAIWYIDGEYVINPIQEQLLSSELNLIVSGTASSISMVECGWKEISPTIVQEAFALWQKEITKLCAWQEAFINNLSIEQLEWTYKRPDDALQTYIDESLSDKEISTLFNTDKKTFYTIFEGFARRFYDHFAEMDIDTHMIDEALYNRIKKWVKETYLRWNTRIDGRTFDVVRKLSSDTDIFPVPHGSAVFTRWETQVANITTLWAPWDALMIDSMQDDEKEKRFMHHYNMPPFSVNEARGTRWPWRREIWHGRLAEKALEPVIPTEEEFPYTVRCVSDTLSSNGSSSMASVCASSLALMDAWVPISAPVAWIAMWLMIDGERYKILTDIQWIEDHLGDMDFKVAWTRKGITALQMDMKVRGISVAILQEAIAQWQDAKDHILNHMQETIQSPREELKPSAPFIWRMKLTSKQIKQVIGPGWSVITEIVKVTGTKIDFQDDWTALITGKSQAKAKETIEMIKDIIREPEVWDTMRWEIKRLEKYGAFVDIGKWKTWLLHIKNVSAEYVEDITTILSLGQEIDVKVSSIDPKDGKIQLARG